jgi:hypothetical protein
VSQPYKLYLNLDRRCFVQSAGSLLSRLLPPVIQGEKIPVELYPLTETGDPTSPLTGADLSTYTVALAIQGPPLLAYQDTWAWSVPNKKFTATVDLTSANLATFLAGADWKTALLEVAFIAAGATTRTKIRGPITVTAAAVESATTPPVTTPTASLTRARGTFILAAQSLSATVVIPTMLASDLVSITPITAGPVIDHVTKSNGQFIVHFTGLADANATYDYAVTYET